MGYSKKELEQKAMKVIESQKLIFIDEIASYLPCCRATFYNHDLDKLDSIKGLIDKNKDEIKASLRAKWYKSDNATLQLALMRLCATDPERRKLAMNYIEHTGKDGNPIQVQTYILPDGSEIKF